MSRAPKRRRSSRTSRHGPSWPGNGDDSRFAEYRRTRSRALRDELVSDHIPLAQRAARRYLHRGEPYDDLMQVALIGLLKAVERFDPERGFRFSTFAMPTIEGALKQYFRDSAWMIRVSPGVARLLIEVRSVMPSLNQERQRAPTTAELAQQTRVAEHRVREAITSASCYRLASLDEPDAAEDGGSHLATTDQMFQRIEDQAQLATLLRALDTRARDILIARFYEEMTQSEIAERFRISQMHVSRLLAQSLDRLRLESRVASNRG